MNSNPPVLATAFDTNILHSFIINNDDSYDKGMFN